MIRDLDKNIITFHKFSLLFSTEKEKTIFLQQRAYKKKKEKNIEEKNYLFIIIKKKTDQIRVFQVKLVFRS